MLTGRSVLISNREICRLGVPQLIQASPEDGNHDIADLIGMAGAGKVREFSQGGSIVGCQDETAAASTTIPV